TTTACATTGIYTLSLHDALPIFGTICAEPFGRSCRTRTGQPKTTGDLQSAEETSGFECSRIDCHPRRTRQQSRFGFRYGKPDLRSEEHTSELQSRENLVCRLLLE